MEIQNEYTQLILAYIYKWLKKHERGGDKDSILEILDFMKDLGLKNEHLKEHLMVLCMDKKTVEQFDAIESQTKAAFTRTFNSEYKEDLTGKKGKKAKGSGAKSRASTTLDEGEENEEEGVEEEEEAGDELLEEDQKNEIKRGKQLEKEMEKKNKKETVDKFELIKLNNGKEEAKKGKAKGKSGAKTAGKPKAKKGAKKGKDEIDSDDSLNGFIVDDDDSDDGGAKKKKKGAKSAQTTGGRGRGKK